MPSFHRILGFTVVMVFVTGLALGREREEAAAARKVRHSVRPSSKALPQATPGPPLQVVQSLSNLPLRFEANQGQTDERVEFLSRGQGYTLFLTGEEAVLSLIAPSADGNSKLETEKSKNENRKTKNAGEPDIQNPKSSSPESPVASVVRMKLEGARTVRAEGIDPLPSKSNHFLGNDPRKWRTSVPNYGRVKYKDVYPGIDLVYYGNQRQLEYDFVVAPGADPKAIRFAVDTGNWKSEIGNSKFEKRNSKIEDESGVPNPKSKIENQKSPSPEPVRVDANGDLVIATDAGDVRFRKPLVYQEETADGSRQSAAAPSLESRAPNRGSTNLQSAIFNRKYIDGRYVLRTEQAETGNGKLEIGNSKSEKRKARNAGDPEIQNPKSKIQNPKYEVAFELAAYNPALPLVIDPVLSYSTLLGGVNAEAGYGVTADSSGNIYVVGTTVSVNFPTKIPFQTDSSGNFEVFVTKVDSTGAALVYSSYLGGSGSDRVSGMALNSSGSVYIAGTTTSTNFPTTSTALQPSFSGGTCGTDLCSDAFVTKIKSDGSGLDYSTYLGGTSADTATGIALDSTGNAYIAGSTVSTNFPTASPLQAASAGNTDAFLAKVKPDGTGLVYSTYLGGTSSDLGEAVAVDSSGNAFVTGYTLSSDFPTANPLPGQGTYKGMSDAFITEINAAGDARIFSTYLGGADADRARAIAVDAAGNVYVGGETSSVDFPVSASPFQAALAPGTCGALPCPDGFLTKLDPAGATALYSTYLGGTEFDQILGVGVNGAEQAFVTGATSSADFPLQNPMQAVMGGGTCSPSPCSDAFVTRVDATGSVLVYSTFLGGSGSDTGQAIFVDGSDNAFVTGFAGSSNFPATPGGFQTTAGGTSSSGDAFVAKIGPADASALIIAPVKLTFADQPNGFTSAGLTITLTNVGTGPIAFASIAVTGDFAQTNTCEPSLSVGSATCTINVTFTPVTTADLTGELTITSDAAGSPHKIPLAGKGIEAKSRLVFLPTTVEFPDQDVETTSAPITVTVSNTGFADITISIFEVVGNYAQTNNCPVTPNKLLIGGSCTADITFKPEGSGVRAGTFSITSDAGNAAAGVNTLSLTGKGIGVFTLSAPTSAVTLKRGTKTTTFTINAEGPSSFTGAVSLACQDSLAACTFDPTSIKVGESSTLTLSNMDLVTPETFSFTVRGTNEFQFAETSFSVTYSDYSIAPKPTFGTVAPGDSFVVRLTLSSKNGFDGSASFSCAGLPQESSCTFNPTTVTLDGINSATVDVTIKTTTRVTTWAPPRPPSTQNPWLTWGAGILALLFIFGARRRRIRHLLLAAVLLALMFVASCNEYYYYTYTGTLPGTFPVEITAKVGTVTHTTGLFLTVL